jgi:asparagine synthase (glutamine-hydrolysing)
MLGIAGAVGGSPTEVLCATQAMTRHMERPGNSRPHTATVTSYEPCVVVGAVVREACPLPEFDQRHAVFHPDGSAMVLAGTILNIECIGNVSPEDGLRSPGRVEQAILDAYVQSGPEIVEHLQGGFALAIWDAQRQRLFLARDRLGIRSLYYSWSESGALLFSSRLTALLASGLIPARLSHPGIHSYLSYGVICEPFTAIDAISSLPPAHWAILQNSQLEFHQYWDLFADGELMPVSLDQAASELRPLLNDSVHRHVFAEQRTCVFLSGGLDSSALAALVSSDSDTVSTVSITLDDPRRSEQPYIEMMSRYLASDHVSFNLGANDARRLFDDYFAAMDQPTVDGLNAFTVAGVAAESGFDAALYGVGGDELFGAVWNLASIRKLERVAGVPARITRPIARLLGNVRWGSAGIRAYEWLMGAAAPGTAFDFLTRLFLESELCKVWLGADNAGEMLGRLTLADPGLYPRLYSRLTLNYFLRNQLLRISDWAGAYYGLDIRLPFLDNNVVGWALRLPPEFKTGAYKPVLVRAVGDLLPPEIITRPKKGFELPLREWMRDELRQDVADVLRRPPDIVADIIDSHEIQQIWNEFQSTGERWGRPWALYTLCRWAEQVTRDTEYSHQCSAADFALADGSATTMT